MLCILVVDSLHKSTLFHIIKQTKIKPWNSVVCVNFPQSLLTPPLPQKADVAFINLFYFFLFQKKLKG